MSNNENVPLILANGCGCFDKTCSLDCKLNPKDCKKHERRRIRQREKHHAMVRAIQNYNRQNIEGEYD